MNKIGMLTMGGFIILILAGSTFGEEGSIVSRKEMDAMKSKVERLKKTFEQQVRSTLKRQDEEQPMAPCHSIWT